MPDRHDRIDLALSLIAGLLFGALIGALAYVGSHG
jgi:hypothetical protein